MTDIYREAYREGEITSRLDRLIEALERQHTEAEGSRDILRSDVVAVVREQSALVQGDLANLADLLTFTDAEAKGTSAADLLKGLVRLGEAINASNQVTSDRVVNIVMALERLTTPRAAPGEAQVRGAADVVVEALGEIAKSIASMKDSIGDAVGPIERTEEHLAKMVREWTPKRGAPDDDPRSGIELVEHIGDRCADAAGSLAMLQEKLAPVDDFIDEGQDARPLTDAEEREAERLALQDLLLDVAMAVDTDVNQHHGLSRKAITTYLPAALEKRGLEVRRALPRLTKDVTFCRVCGRRAPNHVDGCSPDLPKGSLNPDTCGEASAQGGTARLETQVIEAAIAWNKHGSTKTAALVSAVERLRAERTDDEEREAEEAAANGYLGIVIEPPGKEPHRIENLLTYDVTAQKDRFKRRCSCGWTFVADGTEVADRVRCFEATEEHVSGARFCQARLPDGTKCQLRLTVGGNHVAGYPVHKSGDVTWPLDTPVPESERHTEFGVQPVLTPAQRARAAVTAVLDEKLKAEEKEAVEKFLAEQRSEEMQRILMVLKDQAENAGSVFTFAPQRAGMLLRYIESMEGALRRAQTVIDAKNGMLDDLRNAAKDPNLMRLQAATKAVRSARQDGKTYAAATVGFTDDTEVMVVAGAWVPLEKLESLSKSDAKVMERRSARITELEAEVEKLKSAGELGRLLAERAAILEAKAMVQAANDALVEANGRRENEIQAARSERDAALGEVGHLRSRLAEEMENAKRWERGEGQANVERDRAIKERDGEREAREKSDAAERRRGENCEALMARIEAAEKVLERALGTIEPRSLEDLVLRVGDAIGTAMRETLDACVKIADNLGQRPQGMMAFGGGPEVTEAKHRADGAANVKRALAALDLPKVRS